MIFHYLILLGVVPHMVDFIPYAPDRSTFNIELSIVHCHTIDAHVVLLKLTCNSYRTIQTAKMKNSNRFHRSEQITNYWKFEATKLHFAWNIRPIQIYGILVQETLLITVANKMTHFDVKPFGLSLAVFGFALCLVYYEKQISEVE